RERALLGMCVADPKLGREVLGRIGDELLTPLGLRARDWLAGHLADPMEGIERDDEALVSVISAVVMSAGVEPASREAYDLNLMQLEQASLERRISELERSGADPPVELHRQRNLLAERIVRARS
nr:hypothetical protein [Solirubrobacterales bacterium]